jgi:hypothetical protein
MLTEAHIQRYARQILLREVGGRGQTALLSRTWRVEGESAALSVALTYLAAGGSPVDASTPSSGFLAGTTLAQFGAEPPGATRFGTLTTGALPGAGAVVHLGPSAVVGAPSGTCRACIDAALALAPGPVGPPLVLGAAAALLAQRLSLRPDEPPGGLRWQAGRLEPLPWPGCAAHVAR